MRCWVRAAGFVGACVVSGVIGAATVTYAPLLRQAQPPSAPEANAPPWTAEPYKGVVEADEVADDQALVDKVRAIMEGPKPGHVRFGMWTIGCRTQYDLRDVLMVVRQHDNSALAKMFDRNECVAFDEGEHAFIADIDLRDRLAKVRREGQLVGYWVLMPTLDLPTAMPAAPASSPPASAGAAQRAEADKR